MELQWKRKGGRPVLETRENNGIPYLIFPGLEKTGMVIQGFSTRLGGVSTGDCGSMNFSAHLDSDPANVKENIRRFVTAIGADPEKLVMSRQTHTTNVRVVTEKDLGKGYSRPIDYTDVDGLVTDVPGAVLLTSYADCVPLYFVDPVHGVIGLSHSGWRGTVARMGKVTLEVMAREYGTRPEDVHAAIGPSICQDCYEVSSDVVDAFREAFDPRWYESMFRPGAPGKYQLNLQNINAIILKEAGVLPEHLEVTDLCTCCNAGLLHSHRATGGRRGGLGAFLALKEQ